jgi:long-chain acyl-CoA synthetase
VKSFVVVKPGETLTEEDVVRYCKDRLAAYKVPKKVEFMESFPKSAIGKILRREIKELDKKPRMQNVQPP